MNQQEKIEMSMGIACDDVKDFNISMSQVEMETQALLLTPIGESIIEISLLTEDIGQEVLDNAPDELFINAQTLDPFQRAAAGMKYVSKEKLQRYVDLVDNVMKYLAINMPNSVFLDIINHDGIYHSIKGETV